MSRTWKILIVASLVLNLALAGFIAGRWSRDVAMLPPVLGLGWMLNTLPPDRREELRPMVRQAMGEIRPKMRRIRESQDNVELALLARPFEAAALTASLHELRQQMDAAETASYDALVEVVSLMTDEERRAMANVLRHPSAHGGRRERGDNGRRERADRRERGDGPDR